MTLPKSFITITPLSKILALFLFITLPILGFYLGVQYQKNLTFIKQPQPIINPTPTPNELASQVPDSTWKTYTDEEYGFEFEYPSTWSVHELLYDNIRELEIVQPTLRRIIISRLPNPQQLTPRQWFQQNRDTYYYDIMAEIGEVDIQANPALLISQPRTCRTVPMVAAIVSYEDVLFFFTYYEQDKTNSRSSAIELGRLLETLEFIEQPTVTTTIPPDYLQFPDPPENVSYNVPCGG